jgi:D-alanine--poly(phosphoribitol) ligase subunit 1
MSSRLTTKLLQALNKFDQDTVYTASQRNYTFRELKINALAFAGYLEKNFKNNDPVFIFGDHQFEMICAFLSCALTGHPYIPVDSTSGEQRVKAILQTGKPQLIILLDKFPFSLPQSQNYRILSKKQLQNIFQQKHIYQPLVISASTPFYILFTSGTTGSPKGVPISHANLALFINWLLGPDFNLPSKAVFLGQVPYSFDVSNMYWIPAILKGGMIKALSHQQVANFNVLFKLLPQLELQVFVGTPSLAEMFLLAQDFNQEKMPQLKLFLLCGEELTVKLASKLAKRFPQSRIFNTYGPTEATVAVSAWQVDPQKLSRLKRLPLGTAEPQVKLLICDDQLLPVPSGKTGEIIISGPCVSAGYLHNPKKTKTAFFELAGQRTYHTGDLGHFGADGLLYYDGRRDFQIKLHGFRIELAEVRAALEQSSYIKQAVAVPKYGADQRPNRLVAYVILTNKATGTQAKLTSLIRQDLQGKIMPYMLPSQFIFCNQFPLSPNGKIDLKKLIKEANT